MMVVLEKDGSLSDENPRYWCTFHDGRAWVAFLSARRL